MTNFTIVEEVGLLTEEGKEIILQTSVRQIEIPNFIPDFKTAYDLWLEEQEEERKNE